jgi:hypothetical protein
MSEELNYAWQRETAWRKHCDSFDMGSYCESASRDGAAALKILKAYRDLADALLAFIRAEYKGPPQ